MQDYVMMDDMRGQYMC